MFNEDENNLPDESKTNFDELFDDDNSTELNDRIVLYDGDGNEVEFDFLDLIFFENEEFVILMSEEGYETGEVVILRLEESENENEESYMSVDDDETLMAVFNIFKDRFKDYFNFED